MTFRSALLGALILALPAAAQTLPPSPLVIPPGAATPRPTPVPVPAPTVPVAPAPAVPLAAPPAAQAPQPPRQPTQRTARQNQRQQEQANLPFPPGTRVLTLEEAERALMERNLVVVAAQRGVDAARAQRLVSSSLPPPQVSVGNTFASFNETTQGVRGARFIAPTNNINAGLTVLVELGGKRTLRTRLAEENIGVAEAQVLDAMRQQLFVLRQAFIAALGARANLEVALANRRSLNETEALLRRQLRDGALPEGDLLRFQASRVVFDADVTTAIQNYAAAVAQLAVAMAADAAAFPPAPPSNQPSVLPPVAFDVRGRFDTIPEPGIARDELAEAVANRPDVVAAIRQAQAAGANVSLQEAARWRDVTVNGGWSRSRLSQDLPNANGPQVTGVNQFSLNLSVPIFTRQIVEGNIGVARGQQGQAEAQARAALLQARADFATAWAQLEQARNLLRLYTGQGALRRAEEAYQSTQAAYLAGGRSLLEVLDALRTLNATRVAGNAARAAYLTALAQLEAATGTSGLAPRL
jgi:outer membrane protein TolC